ncbi:hypothetical protein H4219_005651 [Mycoemilia scoparia]|uniref:Uncharacterized protein n=1 Tax=Mycoemilia scoparia TaxID=417184 RepID=A0A9W7ZT33_9FUNG|nr:hypothetical protein H4219_005651 [Mycoemilia scoparia]
MDTAAFLDKLFPDLADGFITISHAHVEHLTKALEIISWINIPLCLTIIIIVAVQSRHYDMLDKVSLRLSVVIALGDLVYSIVQIIFNMESFTDKLSEIQIRTLYLFQLIGFHLLVFATTCIAFHLHISTLLGKQTLARKFSPYYELVTIILSVVISHPILYTFVAIRKAKGMRLIIIADKSLSRLRMNTWLMYGTCAICLVYCLFICVIVVIRISKLWIHQSQSNRSIQMQAPETGYNPNNRYVSSHNAGPRGLAGSPHLNNNATTGAAAGGGGGSRLNMSLEKSRVASIGTGTGTGTGSNSLGARQAAKSLKYRRELSFAILRIALYCIVPMITTLWLPAYLSTPHPTAFFTNITLILPGLATMFNFAIFLINPQLDIMWKGIWDWVGTKMFCGTSNKPAVNNMSSHWSPLNESQHEINTPTQTGIPGDRISFSNDDKLDRIRGGGAPMRSLSFRNDPHSHYPPHNYHQGN